jgi:hypothetical protein
LDQAATLEGEVLFFMLGASSTLDMRKTLTKEMNLSESTANQVMIDVNDQIIDKLKQILIQETLEATPAELKLKETASQPIYNSLSQTIENRDKILSEIEKPTVNPVGVYVPPKPVVAPVAPSTTPTPVPAAPKAAAPATPITKTEPVPVNMVASGTAVATPAPTPEKSIMEQKMSGGVKSDPKTYTVDPYRELPGK